MNTSSFALNLLWTFLKLPVLGLGTILASFAVYGHIELTNTFLEPGYEEIWDDMLAYKIRARGHKSLDELFAAYDQRHVRMFAVNESMYACVIPSDDAALYFWASISAPRKEGEEPRVENARYLLFAVLFFPVFYFPVLLLIRSLAESYTWALCRGERAAYLFERVFHPPWSQRILAGLLSLPVVTLFAAVNASQLLTEDLSRVGFNLFNLTVIFLLLSYFSGLGLRLMKSVIEGLLVCVGIDPESSYWDELLTLLIAGPILVLVYKNSILSAASDAMAGLGPLVLAKLLGRRGSEMAQETTAAWPDALIRYSALSFGMVLLGSFSCCCGSVVTLIASTEATPLPQTAAELEKDPPKRKWLEVTEGNLFWPLRTQAPAVGGNFAEIHLAGRYFVPLVSTEVLDDWLTIYRRDGAEAKYPMARCRVIAVIHQTDLARIYPDVAKGQVDPHQPFAPISLRGVWAEYKSNTGIAPKVHSHFAAAPDLPEDKLMLLEKDRIPLGTTIPLVSLAIGILAVPPLGIRLVMGWPRHQHFQKRKRL